MDLPGTRRWISRVDLPRNDRWIPNQPNNNDDNDRTVGRKWLFINQSRRISGKYYDCVRDIGYYYAQQTIFSLRPRLGSSLIKMIQSTKYLPSGGRKHRLQVGEQKHFFPE